MGIYIGTLYLTNVSTIDSDKILTDDDSGIIQQVLVDETLIRLPWTSNGVSYTIINGGYDGTVGINIVPMGTDKIIGGGFKFLDGQRLVNKREDAKKGDFVTLTGDGNRGWIITQIVGNWTDK